MIINSFKFHGNGKDVKLLLFELLILSLEETKLNIKIFSIEMSSERVTTDKYPVLHAHKYILYSTKLLSNSNIF